jgi:tRNA(Ile)-lysidine synthase
MELENTVADFIRRNRLLCHNNLYLVALSGGADSVTLLLVLKRLGYNIEAVHCNFHLRGEESNRDEMFVKNLCLSNNIILHLCHFDTVTYAETHKVSIEMAARALRYNYFDQLRRDISADGICVAHHRDDSVETFLMNVIRGTGLNGLTGIRPLNGFIIRPLLCVCRLDIENYLSKLGQEFVIDSTNLVNDVTRNKIRLDIIPLLKKINPSVSNNIEKTIERISDLLPLVNSSLDSIIKYATVREEPYLEISIEEIMKSGAPENVLFTFMNKYGFTPAQAEQVFYNIKSEPGKIYSSKTHDLIIDRKTILITDHISVPRQMVVPEEGIYIYNDNFKITISHDQYLVKKSLKCEPSKAVFDLDKIKFPLIIRGVHDGDKFVPFGMKGKKLVSDFMTDSKMNFVEKKKQLVLTDENGNIIWLIGKRATNNFRVTEVTKNILQLSIHSI